MIQSIISNTNVVQGFGLYPLIRVRRAHGKTEAFVFKHLALFVCLTSALVLAQTTVDGDWLLTEDIYGNPLHQRLTLKVDGTTLSGTLGRRPIEGTVSGNAIQFTTKNEEATDEFNGTMSAGDLVGTLVHTEKGDQNPFRTLWSARRVPAKRVGPPQRHEFVPTIFHRQFSASNPPVLR